MPNLTPRDTYNPNASVSPETASPGDYLNVRANPQEFGAQVGQGLEKVGQTLGQSSDLAQQYAVTAQGFLNEHAANMAEQDATIKGGQIYDEYKKNTGLAAANSKDQYVAAIQQVYNKVGEGLNPAARRAYEQQSIRRLSFTIQDMNSYAADQTKSALKTGKQSAIDLSVARVGQYSVASNPGQFGFEVGTSIFHLNDILTNPAVGGPYAGLAVKTNKDGTLSFDTSTLQGQTAQADYDNQRNQLLTKMWVARGDALFDGDPQHPGTGNVQKVMDLLGDKNNNIPPLARAELMKKYSGPYKQQLGWQIGEETLSHATADYATAAATGSETTSPYNLGNVKTVSGTYAQPATATDGVILAANNLRSNNYQGKTLAEIGKTWSNGDPNWAKNVSGITGIPLDSVPNLNDPTVVKTMLHGIAVAEKNKNEASAFSSGLISQGVDAAFSGQKAKFGTGSGQGPGYASQVDYIAARAPIYEEQARRAVLDKGGDAQLAEMAAEHVRTRISEQVSGQQSQIRLMEDNLAGLINNPQHPITSETQLDYSSDPKVKQQWIDLQHLNTFAAEAMRRMIRAQALGTSKSYGTDIYNKISDVWSGKITDIGQVAEDIGGDHSPLSASGTNVIYKELQSMQSPQGQAFNHKTNEFLHTIYGQMTGTSQYPGINPGQFKENFDKWLQGAIPRIQAARDKNDYSVFDPTNKEYLGNTIKLPSVNQVSTAQMTALMLKNRNKVDYKSADDLVRALHSKKITRQEFDKIATEKKWGRPASVTPGTPPSVPLPEGWNPNG